MAGSGKRVATTCFCGRVTAEALTESEGFPVGRCGKCGTIRTLERLDDYELLYTDGDRYHKAEMDKIRRPHYTDRVMHDYALARDHRLRDLLGGFAVLDVGSANGAYVRALKDFGFHAEGLELNPGIADWSKENLAIQVHTSWSTITTKFDRVVFNDCFEHVVDLGAELQRVRAVMRAEGVLIIDQPDGDEVFGPHARAPHHAKSAQHLWYLSETAMNRLLAGNGFILERVTRPIVGKLVTYARKNG